MVIQLNVLCEVVLKIKIISLIMIVTMFSNIFSQTVVEIEPYTEDNIPSWAKDARRMSVITLGSIPFTTLATTLGYSVYRYIANDFNADYIPNPFPTSSTAAKLDQDEQIGIIITAAALGLAIGITDFIVIKVEESREEKAQEREESERIQITPIITEVEGK